MPSVNSSEMKDVKPLELFNVMSIHETHWSISDEVHRGDEQRKLPELQSGLSLFRTGAWGEVTPGCP